MNILLASKDTEHNANILLEWMNNLNTFYLIKLRKCKKVLSTQMNGIIK